MSQPPAPVPSSAELRARQRRTLRLLGFVLLVSGLVILIFLKKIPLPMRLGMGCVDAIAGVTLLLVVRQKFDGK